MRVLLLRGAFAAGVQIELAIKQLDCAIDAVATAEEAWAALAVNAYDLAIVDLDCLEEDTRDFLRQLRSAYQRLHVFVLAGRSAVDRVASALDQGADDFLIKPIDADELRLRASGFAARRSERGADELVCGPLRLERYSRDVSLDGKVVDLSPRERAVLQVLLRERGKVVSKDYIASRIFSLDDDARPSAIETYVSRLRRKTAHPRVEIRTVHGLGYLLMDQL